MARKKFYNFLLRNWAHMCQRNKVPTLPVLTNWVQSLYFSLCVVAQVRVSPGSTPQKEKRIEFRKGKIDVFKRKVFENAVIHFMEALKVTPHKASLIYKSSPRKLRK